MVLMNAYTIHRVMSHLRRRGGGGRVLHPAPTTIRLAACGVLGRYSGADLGPLRVLEAVAR